MIVTDPSDYQPWVARKGTNQGILITCVDSNGTAFNLSSYTFYAELWRYGASEAFLEATVVNGGATGLITISFTAAQLDIAPSKDYFWILRTTAPTPQVWFNGPFTLNSALWNGTPTTSITATVELGTTNITVTITLLGGTSSSGSASALARTAVKTTNYSAAANDLVPVDTTSGNVQITLPNAPSDKVQVAVKHIIQGSSNVVTIVCTGADVFNKTSGGTSLTITLLNQALWVQYDSATKIWTVLADDLPLSGLDLRYSITQKVLPAGDYTLILSDANKQLISDSASAINITIPPYSSVAWPAGSYVELFQRGAGQVTVVAGAGVTINKSNTASAAIPAQYCSAALQTLEVQNTWEFQNGTAASGATDANMTFSDIATGNASTSKHGFMPKLVNDPTKYFDSQGNQTVPPGAATDVNISTSDVTNNNVSTAKHGWMTKAPNDDQQVFLGDATWGPKAFLQHAIGTGNDRYITGAINGTSPNTAAAVANTLRVIPIIVPFKITVDKLICEITTGTTGKIRMGIWASNSSGYPTALMVDSGEVTITTPAVLSVASLSAVLKPGMYFIGYLTDTANTMRAHQLAALNPLMGTSIAMGIVVGIGWTVAQTYGALPNPFTAGGTVMTTGTPIVAYRGT